jgi:APA family basic amino acid/polyamine antiporter
VVVAEPPVRAARSQKGPTPSPRLRRRREPQGLERVLGTPALFSTAYGDVGSSIYYALGLTASFALGLTPVVFVIAGVFFVATAATYAEGTVRFPEAGGSSSFARHAFNEVWSFGAAWAQMLNYVVTISISAFFVPHYLSVFWGPLRTNPWDIVGGAIVIAVLVALNVFGIREAARLNVVLAVVDFSTQLLLVLLGAALIFKPHILAANVHWGVAPRWSQFFLAIPIGMIAYTGMETISNLAEETREPPKDVPRAYKLVAGAVFAIYLTLPAIALMALPVHGAHGHYSTLLGESPPRGFANDPVLGIVQNLGLHGVFLTGLRYYVGVLAGTILIIAANAGVIGSSRVTYAMSTYRQLPERLRRLHPRFKTPWLSLIFFSGLLSILTLIPGKIDFLGTMYSFGAMLSFALANAAIITLRYRFPDAELQVRSWPNLRFRGVDWPLFAFVGLGGTAAAWLVVVVQRPTTRWVGVGWLALGFAAYVVYRKWVVREPLSKTVRAPLAVGVAAALEYRRILVPLVGGAESEHAVDLACRLAAEKGAQVVAVAPVEVPLELPLDRAPDLDRVQADTLLEEARTIGDSYGVQVVGRLVQTRNAGRAIVDEAVTRGSEIIVLGAPRRQGRRGPIFEKTVELVLRHAPCRVMVATPPNGVEPPFKGGNGASAAAGSPQPVNGNLIPTRSTEEPAAVLSP